MIAPAVIDGLKYRWALVLVQRDAQSHAFEPALLGIEALLDLWMLGEPVGVDELHMVAAVDWDRARIGIDGRCRRVNIDSFSIARRNSSKPVDCRVVRCRRCMFLKDDGRPAAKKVPAIRFRMRSVRFRARRIANGGRKFGFLRAT